MMKKLALVLAILMVLAFSACGGETAAPAESTAPAASEAAGSEATEAPVEAMDVALSTPVTGSSNLFGPLEDFSATINESTNGALTVNLFGDNSLGAQRDVFASMTAGDVQLILDGSVPVDLYAPEYAFLTAPYMVRSQDHMKNLMESEIWDSFVAKLEENNITILGTYFRGARQMVSVDEVDFAALDEVVIRMPDVSAYVTAWDTVGTNVQVMGAGEVYTSLETGVINATEGPLSQHQVLATYEVTNHIYMTNHVQEFYALYANKDWVDSLSPEVYDALMADATTLCSSLGEVAYNDDMTAREFLIGEGGMTMHEDVDVSALFEATNDVWNEKFESGEWAYSLDEVLSYE